MRVDCLAWSGLVRLRGYGEGYLSMDEALRIASNDFTDALWVIEQRYGHVMTHLWKDQWIAVGVGFGFSYTAPGRRTDACRA